METCVCATYLHIIFILQIVELLFKVLPFLSYLSKWKQIIKIVLVKFILTSFNLTESNLD